MRVRGARAGVQACVCARLPLPAAAPLHTDACSRVHALLVPGLGFARTPLCAGNSAVKTAASAVDGWALRGGATPRAGTTARVPLMVLPFLPPPFSPPGPGAMVVARCVWVATRCSPFWDMVVLTATDEKQAESYRLQLEEKQKLTEIPSLK